MRILIIAGIKTNKAADTARNNITALEVDSLNFTDEIRDYLSRGDIFDKAIIFENGLTHDGEITDVDELKHKMFDFIQRVKQKVELYSIVIVVKNRNLGLGLLEVTASNDKIIIIQQGEKVSTSFLRTLVSETFVEYKTKCNVITMDDLRETAEKEVKLVKTADEPEVNVDDIIVGKLEGEKSSGIDPFADAPFGTEENNLENSSDPFNTEENNGDATDPFGAETANITPDPFEDENNTLDTNIPDPFEDENTTPDINNQDINNQDINNPDPFEDENNTPDTNTLDPFEDENNTQDINTPDPFEDENKTQDINTPDPFGDEKTTDINTPDPFEDENNTQDINTPDPFEDKNNTQDINTQDPFEDENKTPDIDTPDINTLDPFEDNNKTQDINTPDPFEDVKDTDISTLDPFEDSNKTPDINTSDPFTETRKVDTTPIKKENDPYGLGNANISADPFNDTSSTPVNKHQEIRNKHNEISDELGNFNPNISDPFNSTSSSVKNNSADAELFEDIDTETGNSENEQVTRSQQTPVQNNVNKNKKVKQNTDVQSNRKNNVALPQNDKIARLKERLEVYKRTGAVLTITGGASSGKTVIAANLANILTDFGYSVLLMDFDTNGRGLSYINKEHYNVMNNSTDQNNTSDIKAALQSTSDRLGRFIKIIRPNLNLLGTAIKVDKENPMDCLDDSKVARVIHSLQAEYNFIIIEIPFDAAVNKFTDTLDLADHIILTERLSNNGVMNFLIDMMSIEDENLTDELFERAKIVFNMDTNMPYIFGKKAKNTSEILKAMDERLYEIIGYQIDYSFANMTAIDCIPFMSLIENSYFSKKYASEVSDGKALFTNLLINVFEVK